MKKIITTFALTAALSLPLCVFADSTTMTVDEAVSYAIEHSDSFIKSNAEIQANTYSAYQTKATQSSLKKNPYLEDMSVDVYLSFKGYYHKASKLAATVAERAKADLIKSTERNVKNDFYTYLNSAVAVEIAEENLSITKERMAAAEKKLEMGTLSKLDCENFALARQNAENSYNQAIRTKEYNLIKLKNTINFPKDKELKPVGEFIYEGAMPTSPEEAIEKSRSSNTYLNLKDAFELAKLKWANTSVYYTSTENNYKVEKATYEAAEADFRINVNNIDLNIINMYNSIVALREQVEYMQSYTAYLKSTTDAMFLRYEMGVVTANDYRQTQQEYFKAQNELQTLQLTYEINKMNYEGLFS